MASFKQGKMLPETLVGILISLFVIVTLILIIYSIAPTSSKKVDEVACEASVASRAQQTFDAGVVGKVTAGPFLCRTQIKNVGEEAKKSPLIIKKPKLLPYEEAQASLADDLKRCWKMMGQGRYRVDQENVKFFDSSTSCFACFDVGLPSSLGQSLTDNQFRDIYLASTPAGVPTKKGEKPVSYLNYITRSGGCGYVVMPQVIEGGRRYGVVYVSNPGAYASEMVKVGGITASVGVGALALRSLGLVSSVTPLGLAKTTIVAVGSYGIYYFGNKLSEKDFPTAFENAIKDPTTEKLEALKNAAINYFPRDCSGLWIVPSETIPDSCYNKPVRS